MFTKLTRPWLLAILAGVGVLIALIIFINLPQSKSNLQAAQLNPAPNSTAVATLAPTNKAGGPNSTSLITSRVGDEYIALGDSVAYGVGASPPEQSGYAGVFYQQYLKRLQPNLLYKNLAIPGETSASFVARTKSRSQLEKTLDELDAAQKAGRRVSPITLTIGGNDMLAARTASQSEKQATLARFDTNLQNILTQIAQHTELGGKTDLILTTYYNPFAYNSQSTAEDAAWIQRFNDILKKRATEFKARVADFYEPIVGKEQELTWIAQGDIHPNTPGHALLAAALWRMSGYDTKG